MSSGNTQRRRDDRKAMLPRVPAVTRTGPDAGAVRPACPILLDTQEIRGTSQLLVKQIRRLRRDLNGCQTCSGVEDCAILKEYNQQVNTAVTEVLDEWGQA